MDIRGALQTLDPTRDDQWTADGLPRVDVLQALGLKDVTRGQITHAAPTFTRFNTNLEEEGEDMPDGAPPEPIDEPKASSFHMESSDFAGAAPLEPPPPPPPPAVDPDAAKAAIAAAEAELEAAKQVEAKAKEARERASKARDLALLEADRQRTPHEAQQVIMNFLESCKPKGTAPQKVEPSPIDKAHARPQGYGKERPMYPYKQ